MKNNKIQQDLEGVMEALNLEDLSDEEKQAIQDEATANFEALDGVEFENVSKKSKEDKIISEFNTTKKVLQTNISRTEKLTKAIFNNIALDTNDLNMLNAGITVITAQNQNIKLLGDLQNKQLLNIEKQKKIDKENKDNKKDNKPKGFSLR